MPESKDLGMERSPTPKTLPNRRKQRENDREHGIWNLKGLPRKFN